MMVKFNNGRGAIVCNKCRIIINDNLSMMTKEAFDKHSVRRHYCGECIQKRISKYCREKESK